MKWTALKAPNTASNTLISLNFQVWKFCGKASNRRKLCGNCAFPQNFHTRKFREITVFYAVEKYYEFMKKANNYRSYFEKFKGSSPNFTYNIKQI